ncbi:MAG: hypothetical protein AVDCRST_MAG66-1331, partial [uncultured Pseudonocardia sp.]
GSSGARTPGGCPTAARPPAPSRTTPSARRSTACDRPRRPRP